MRKIEREMIEAIKGFKNYQNDNTRVAVASDNSCIWVELHGNEIARIYFRDDLISLHLSNCGYRTKTTKSRLNCILNHFGKTPICQRKGNWFQEDELWNDNMNYQIKRDKKPQPKEFDAVLGSKKERKERFDKCLREILG